MPQLQRSATILQPAVELAQRIYSSMPAKYSHKLRLQTSTHSDLCLTPAAVVASHIPQTQLESLLLPKRALITTSLSHKGQVIATLDPHDPRLSLLRFQYHFSRTKRLLLHLRSFNVPLAEVSTFSYRLCATWPPVTY